MDCVSRVLRNAARLPQAPVPTPILDSWRRSMEQHRLDPGSLQGPRILSQTLLDECRERSELFLRIASEEVARLHGRVRDADYCVLLTDAQGRTIDYRVESTIRNDCRKAGLYLGTCWSEGEEGTCGVAAVLTDRTAVTVHKRDHFRAAFIDLTCSAAPVFDPQGELLGVLDVSAVQSPDDRRSQHLIRQMVAQSAREIENAFFMHSAQGHWVLRAHRAPGYVDSQPDYLFAWDADGRLLALNPAARHYLRQRLGQVPSHIGEVFDLDALHAAADQVPCLLRGQAGELHVRLQRAAGRRGGWSARCPTTLCSTRASPKACAWRCGSGPQPAGADPGRDRRRQGGFRPPVAPGQRPSRQTLRRAQLRGDSRKPDRERAVRLRWRSLYRRGGERDARPAAAGRWRYPVPRRDR